MYPYGKVVSVQVKLWLYRTTQQEFTSNDVHIHNKNNNNGLPYVTIMMELYFFNQNRKLIAINNNN